MLMQASREALSRNEPAQAVALAEELLDEEPDEVEALLIVADAAPRYGHAEVGVLAAEQARRRGARAGAAEAAARLAACDVDGAVRVADEVLAGEPDDARAHAIRGQALELLGRHVEADVALARAHALKPDAYPTSLAVPDDAWDTTLFAAQSELDPESRDALQGVRLGFADLPRLEDLRALHPPPSPTVDALLRREADGSTVVTLFRRNLARGCADLDDLQARMRAALETEAGVLLDEQAGDDA